jgi:hypothetical protein
VLRAFNGSKIESNVYENLKVQVYDDAAVATAISVVKGSYKGKDNSGKYPWTDTWVKRGGQWQCVASHASKIVQKQFLLPFAQHGTSGQMGRAVAIARLEPAFFPSPSGAA